MGVSVGVLLFLLGTAAGSFLNVLALRYDPDEPLFRRASISGRSRCPHCGRTLRWFELIPLVSFALQRGSCRSCGSRLSWQYPVVELLAGALVAALPLILYRAHGVQFTAAISGTPLWFYALVVLWIIAGLTLLLLSVIDLRLFVIPDGATATVGAAGILIAVIEARAGAAAVVESSFGFYADLFGLQGSPIASYAVAVAVGVGSYGLIHLLSRGRAMGLGDVKFGAAAGLLLGWPDVVLAVALSFVFGAAWHMPALLTGRRHMREGVPFGPFIAAAILAVALFGKAILAGYFALFPV